MRTDFVSDTLDPSPECPKPEESDALIHQSDTGMQYVSICYSKRLAETGIEPLVANKGDSYDNALPETINGLCKAELILRKAP